MQLKVVVRESCFHVAEKNSIDFEPFSLLICVRVNVVHFCVRSGRPSGVPFDEVVCILYGGVVYFQNVMICHVVRVRVTACGSAAKCWAFPALNLTLLRHAEQNCGWLRFL